MEIVLHDPAAVGEFAQLVRPLLDGDPVRHTLILTVLDGMVRRGERAEVLVSLHAGGDLVGAALRTPGRPLHVSAVPVEHAVAVDATLASADPLLTAVSGPTEPAEAFAVAHTARAGSVADVRLRMRLFALGTLVPPTGVLGAARRAAQQDVALLGGWRHAFEVGEGHGGADLPEATAFVERSVAGGAGEMLWERNGIPVSYASARPVVAGMSRIGPVYTPPEHRRHGYAAGVTAAAASWALAAGAQTVLLFTDLANPTTNALYPRIGFGPVHDTVELSFRQNLG